MCEYKEKGYACVSIYIFVCVHIYIYNTCLYICRSRSLTNKMCLKHILTRNAPDVTLLTGNKAESSSRHDSYFVYLSVFGWSWIGGVGVVTAVCKKNNNECYFFMHAQIRLRIYRSLTRYTTRLPSNLGLKRVPFFA